MYHSSIMVSLLAFSALPCSHAELLLLPQLEYWPTCNLHITTAQVETSKSNDESLEKFLPYELEILKFPTVRSSHYFSIIRLSNSSTSQKSERVTGTLLCGTFQVKLNQSKSNFCICIASITET